jgi:hypothetical protein
MQRLLAGIEVPDAEGALRTPRSKRAQHAAEVKWSHAGRLREQRRRLGAA